eukprot:6151400-Alexandrium_andersonii.AAC.1
MSASLVGSEMCIRDRATRCWAAYSRKARNKGGRGELDPSQTDEATPYCACLLYTSDAADDM